MSGMHAIEWFDTLSLIYSATKRLLLFAFREEKKKRINNINRKWNQIKIPKHKIYTQTKYIKSILQTNSTEQIENHNTVHSNA